MAMLVQAIMLDVEATPRASHLSEAFRADLKGELAKLLSKLQNEPDVDALACQFRTENERIYFW